MTSAVFFILLNSSRERSLRASVTKPPAGQFAKNAGPETGHALATIADDPHLAHAVADAIDFSQQPHSLGNVISETPEVDDVAASAQRRRMFDQGRLEARRFQPKR